MMPNENNSFCAKSYLHLISSFNVSFTYFIQINVNNNEDMSE